MRYKIAVLVVMMFFVSGWSVEITPPPGWQQQLSTPRSVEKLYALPVPQGEFSPNLAISHYQLPNYREGANLDSVMKQLKGSQERVFPLYKIVEKGKRKVGRIDGGYILVTYARAELDIAALQYFFFQGEDFVNVVYTCLAKDLGRLRPEFEKSLGTMKAVPMDAARAVKPGTGTGADPHTPEKPK